jgi:glycosyltransferase involved in cell wall biosynthesis
VRILYACADRGIPLRGHKGASVHMRSLAAALARRGNQVTVACRNLEGDNPLPAGVRVEQLPADEELHQSSLRELLREVRADVALERYSLSSGHTQAAARAWGIPFVLEVNAPLVDEAARYRGLDNVDQWRSREREVLGGADLVIAVSTGVKAHVLQTGVDPGRVVMIHNGVDLAGFDRADGKAVRVAHNLENAMVLGFCGSLKPWHGVDALIQVLDALPTQIRLLIVGDGPQRADLEKRARDLGVAGRVVFTGAVAHLQVPGYLAAMDIAAAPYLPQENFYFSPLKVLEYLAAGRPVVASDQGDMRVLVGKAGVLVPPGDLALLAEAVRTLAADPQLRAWMTEAARSQVRDHDWTSVAEQVEITLASLKAAA